MRNEKKENSKVKSSLATKIDYLKLKDLLERAGYKKYYTSSDSKKLFPEIVKTKGFLIEKVNLKSILYQFENSSIYEEKVNHEAILDFRRIFETDEKLLKDQILNLLSLFDGQFAENTNYQSYFFFRNTAIMVFEDNIEEINYCDFGLFVWRNQIHNFSFHLKPPKEIRKYLFSTDNAVMELSKTFGYHVLRLIDNNVFKESQFNELDRNDSVLFGNYAEDQMVFSPFWEKWNTLFNYKIYEQQFNMKIKNLESKALLINKGFQELLFDTDSGFIDFVEGCNCDEVYDKEYLYLKYDEIVFPDGNIFDFNDAVKRYAKLKNYKIEYSNGRTGEEIKFVEINPIEYIF